MSFKENPKHIHKREQNTPLTIEEAKIRKRTHRLAIKEATLLSSAQPTSSLDRIHEIIEHIEMNGKEPKFKRYNTAWTDGSLLKTNSKKCMGAAVVWKLK
jgi:hypothetical protein